MITIKNMPRRSLQVDSNYAFFEGLEPWPRFFEHQDKLLASDKVPEDKKQLLRNWIAGKPIEECI